MPAGQKILHHRSDVLETVVLINPSDEAVSTEVKHVALRPRAEPHSGMENPPMGGRGTGEGGGLRPGMRLALGISTT